MYLVKWALSVFLSGVRGPVEQWGCVRLSGHSGPGSRRRSSCWCRGHSGGGLFWMAFTEQFSRTGDHSQFCNYHIQRTLALWYFCTDELHYIKTFSILSKRYWVESLLFLNVHSMVFLNLNFLNSSRAHVAHSSSLCTFLLISRGSI